MCRYCLEMVEMPIVVFSQQLRSLITELTMGHDYMKVRRRNIRAATNTLLLIISVYLISNLLSLFLSVSVFIQPGKVPAMEWR